MTSVLHDADHFSVLEINMSRGSTITYDGLKTSNDDGWNFAMSIAYTRVLPESVDEAETTVGKKLESVTVNVFNDDNKNISCQIPTENR